MFSLITKGRSVCLTYNHATPTEPTIKEEQSRLWWRSSGGEDFWFVSFEWQVMMASNSGTQIWPCSIHLEWHFKILPILPILPNLISSIKKVTPSLVFWNYLFPRVNLSSEEDDQLGLDLPKSSWPWILLTTLHLTSGSFSTMKADRTERRDLVPCFFQEWLCIITWFLSASLAFFSCLLGKIAVPGLLGCHSADFPLPKTTIS